MVFRRTGSDEQDEQDEDEDDGLNVVSEDDARAFLAVAPNARYTDVSGAGHMVAGDRNDRFTEAVVGFLSEVHRAPR